MGILSPPMQADLFSGTSGVPPYVIFISGHQGYSLSIENPWSLAHTATMSDNDDQAIIRPLQLFSQEKMDEFREMTLEACLIWLEEANRFARLIHGKEGLARMDERFRDLPE